MAESRGEACLLCDPADRSEVQPLSASGRQQLQIFSLKPNNLTLANARRSIRLRAK